MQDTPRHAVPEGTISRRRLLGWLGAAGVGAAGASAVTLTGRAGAAPVAAIKPARGTDVVPFYGPHQAGIATPQPAHVSFAAIDVVGGSREDLHNLLRTWTEAAARLTKGRPAGVASLTSQPPLDTGEAVGLPASNLTVTFGVGPSLFERRIAAGRPDALIDLPTFATDRLDPNRTGGDLCIQACADDEQVAFHATRELLRLGRGVVKTRWSQLGFLPRTAGGGTPRNLMGFRDGTNNISGTDVAALARYVWVGSEGPAWLRGGSYLVARRIRVKIEAWDDSALDEQERVFGRHKVSGAPFGGTSEHDPVDLEAKGSDGKALVPLSAHIRQAAPRANGDERILRRGFSYADGVAPGGRLDAGLFFLAYQRDPRRQFVRIQGRLSRVDALNEYIEHTGSAVFAMFPGVAPGGFIGQALL